MLKKSAEFFKVNTFLAISAFKHLLASTPSQKKVNFCQKLQIFEGDQKEITSMSRSQNVEKIRKIRQSEHIFGNFSFQASSCFHSYPKIITFAEKCKILYVTKTN